MNGDRELNEALSGLGEMIDALNSGVSNLMVGQRIVAARAEVYDSEGGIGFELETEDGSTFECVVVGRVNGPASELIAMAGGVNS
jgi:hypothetical protein